MLRFLSRKRLSILCRPILCLVLAVSLNSSFPTATFSQDIESITLPRIGTMVNSSSTYVPVLLRGLEVDPETPLRIQFFIDSGDNGASTIELQAESERLIKYFLAALTVPKGDLWVNLSPYEKNRILPESLGKTELGRDMLAQDYILKQFAASLTCPEKELGKKFWDTVRKKAAERFGVTEIPVKTFNKVWILPDDATVYEDGNTVYVGENHLKVFLDEDYQALKNEAKIIDESKSRDDAKSLELMSQVFREVIIPEIETEINSGENFARIRQVFHALILAKWYKETLSQSLLTQIYADQNKTPGIELADKNIKNAIFDRYMAAFEKGVFDLIKDDYDVTEQEIVPRKYFSGGVFGGSFGLNRKPIKAVPQYIGNAYRLGLALNPVIKQGDGPAVSSSAVSEQIKAFLRTTDLQERKVILDWLVTQRKNDVDAEEIATVADRIRRELPPLKDYNEDNIVVEFLPKALSILRGGNDFAVLYLPAIDATTHFASVTTNRWEKYGYDQNGSDLFIDYQDGVISSFKDETPDLSEKITITYPDYEKTIDRPEQIQLVTLDRSPQAVNETLVQAQLKDIKNEMRVIREEFAAGQYILSVDKLEKIRARLANILAENLNLRQEYTPLFYLATVMSRKVSRGYKGMFTSGDVSHATQILLLDHQRRRVLLQERGPYKRLFAGKKTVSANTKETDPAKLGSAVVKAVRDEVGLKIEESQIQTIGRPEEYQSTLISYDFHALDNAEAALLEAATRQLAPSVMASRKIFVVYDQIKKAACVYSVDENTPRTEVERVAKDLAQASGIPLMHPVYNRGSNSLVLVQLTEAQEKEAEALSLQKKTKKEIAQRIYSKKDQLEDIEAQLEILDSDNMGFVDWLSIYYGAQENPQDYAQDLTAPYFSSLQVWQRLSMDNPEILSVADPVAESLAITGGKGRNTAILQKLSRAQADLRLPRTTVITTFAYDRYVLGNQNIRGLINRLDEVNLSETELIQRVEAVKSAIQNLDLPAEFVRQIADAFSALGGKIAVRSSATMEDLQEYAAAGQADSFLNVIDQATAVRRVKDVWASLFNVGFVKDRRAIHPNKSQADYQMAVLLQELIDATVAGAAKTIGNFGRPVIHINAMPGLGEMVVEGVGAVDSWDVNLTADTVVEHKIEEKKVKLVTDSAGSTRRVLIDQKEPSLTDAQVLKLAKVIRGIQKYYHENGLAKYVDVEFAFNAEGEPVILQARSENVNDSSGFDSQMEIVLETVDEAAIPVGTKSVHLNDMGISASLGTVTGKLIIINNEYGKEQVETGSIVVTLHTNNEWNDVFAKMAGIITADGGDTSHAAKNSRRLSIPSVVGASGSKEQLAVFAGQEVTFDSINKVVYLGRLPTKQVRVAQTIWAENEDQYLENLTKRDQHELYRPWARNRTDRYGVFINFFDGTYRKRSANYPYFEVNYYYQAWDRLTAYLNKRYASRRAWELKPQGRLIRDSALFHRIVDGHPGSIYAFLSEMDNSSLNDLFALFEERFKGFRHFQDFMATIDYLDRENISEVMDELVEIFQWMHFAYWLNATLNINYLPEQIASINPEFQDIFRTVAAHDLPEEERIDVSRNKDREIFVVLETIRANPVLEQAFLSWDPKFSQTPAIDPDLLARIEGWSHKFKKESENILDFSDTFKYLVDLKERLERGLIAQRELILQQFEFLKDEKGRIVIDLDEIRKNDPDLYMVLRGQARVLAALEKESGFLTHSPQYRQRRLSKITNQDIDVALPSVVAQITADLEARKKDEHVMEAILEHYPELKKTLLLSKRETLLREDGHHLIVPLQRKIAKMMLDSAPKFRDILEKDDDIFELATAELIALFKEEPNNRRYIKASFARRRLEDFADKRLRAASAEQRSEALIFFRQSVKTSVEILRDQLVQSRTPEAVAYFQQEIIRLEERLTEYEAKYSGPSSTVAASPLTSQKQEVGGMDFNSMTLRRKKMAGSLVTQPALRVWSSQNVEGMTPQIYEFAPLPTVKNVLTVK